MQAEHNRLVLLFCHVYGIVRGPQPYCVGMDYIIAADVCHKELLEIAGYSEWRARVIFHIFYERVGSYAVVFNFA